MVSLIDDLMSFFGLPLSGQLTFVDLFNSYCRVILAVMLVCIAFTMIAYMVKEISRGLR